MPFCIIFFILTIIYFVIYRPQALFSNNLGFLLLCFIISAFIEPAYIASDIAINMLFIALLVLVSVFSMRYVSRKALLFTFLFAFSIGIGYIVLLQTNLFISIDYTVYFALIISSIPLLLQSKDVYSIMFASSIFTLVITVCEGLFWYSELQYTDLNTINLLNYMTLCMTLGLVLLYIRKYIVYVVRRRHEKSI